MAVSATLYLITVIHARLLIHMIVVVTCLEKSKIIGRKFYH